MNTIKEILSELRTDKEDPRGHSYGDFYDDLFSKYDREAALNILELGVEHGGSLVAWKRYFPNANVYGVDFQDLREEEYKDPGINFILKDLHDAVYDLQMVPFDIIIDDSDHLVQTVSWVAKHYFPLLRVGGIMVIEDIQNEDTYMEGVMAAVPKGAFILGHDLRDVKKRHDDYLITLVRL